MYTKKTLTDQVLIAASGGKLSEDANVWREDIEAYVPAAIAHVLQEDIDSRLERETLQKRRTRSNVMPIVNNEYTFVYDLEVKLDELRLLNYVELPGRLMKLSRKGSVSQVVPYNGTPLTIVANQGEMIGLEDVDQAFTWIENYTTLDKLMISGLSPAVERLLVHAAIDPSNIGEDDPLPIPQYLEVKVVELCLAFFNRQRGVPADAIADNTDVNEVRDNR